MSKTSVEVVQRQVDAYNRRDIDAFVVTYHDEVRIFRLPSTTPAMVGKAALREFYATKRFNLAGLHAEVRQRIVLGNKVIDQEYVTGIGDQPLKVVAAYAVVLDGLITTVWFLSPA